MRIIWNEKRLLRDNVQRRDKSERDVVVESRECKKTRKTIQGETIQEGHSRRDNSRRPFKERPFKKKTR